MRRLAQHEYLSVPADAVAARPRREQHAAEVVHRRVHLEPRRLSGGVEYRQTEDSQFLRQLVSCCAAEGLVLQLRGHLLVEDVADAETARRRVEAAPWEALVLRGLHHGPRG